MILSQCKKSGNYIIMKIVANKEDSIRLYRLGIKKGEKLYFAEKISGGGALIEVLGSEIIIGKTVCRQIVVESA